MPDIEQATERTALLLQITSEQPVGGLNYDPQHEARGPLVDRIRKVSRSFLESAGKGERLPYNDYTTIDWLHELTASAKRKRTLDSDRSLRGQLLSYLDSVSGWIAAVIIGLLTACIAFLVDMAVATASNWKSGYCSVNPLWSHDKCCGPLDPGPSTAGYVYNWTKRSDICIIPTGRSIPEVETGQIMPACIDWVPWREDSVEAFAVYGAFSFTFAAIAGGVTLLSKGQMPSTSLLSELSDSSNDRNIKTPSTREHFAATGGKTLYLAAGSGIPEIKTLLSGFRIPGLLSLRTLLIKAIGATLAVAAGLCLGKEGPFVHISTCVASIVASFFPKYRHNGRKLRGVLSAGAAAGLAVAFGAPIGGVLFSYEEISTFFPRRVLWRALLCSLAAAMALRGLNPLGTGKLVLFETDYGARYAPEHYVAFAALGIAGGLFGGVFCKANFHWARWFRGFGVIKKHPVLEVVLVTLITTLVQFPNPGTRLAGEDTIKSLLADCRNGRGSGEWVCRYEVGDTGGRAWKGEYMAWLVHGTLAKLVLTIVTFGIKVPSGIIIPALCGGAFFGRLLAQGIPLLDGGSHSSSNTSPGIFALVGAAAFLAGVSRMTISLCVVMLELTGELEYVVPVMLAILIAKWTADCLEPRGVYDLAQDLLGHPFLDTEHALFLAQRNGGIVRDLCPPKETMDEITLSVGADGCVKRRVLKERLMLLKRRGILDAGLVIMQEGRLQGYLGQGELELGLAETQATIDDRASSDINKVRVLGQADGTEGLDISGLVDRNPLVLSANAPIEHLVEIFCRIGVRYLIIDSDGGRVEVIIKKRLLMWLEGLQHR